MSTDIRTRIAASTYSEIVRLLAPCCAAALGVWQLGQPSLWIDEAFTARAVNYDYEELVDELHLLYYLMMKPWASVVGTSEFALRLPSVLAAVVAVVLLYGLARMLLGERVAIVASLLLALNPFVVMWAQQARSYTFILALAIATTWLLVRALERPRGAMWVAYGLATVLLIVMQFFVGLLVLAAHGFAAWKSKQARLTWAVIVVASSPWIVKRLAEGEKGGPTTWLQKPDLRDLGAALVSLPGALGVGVVLASIGALLIERRWRPLLVSWAVVPFLLSLAMSAYKPVFLDRYLIVSSPAFAMLAAVALVELSGRVRIAAVTGAVAATIVGLLLWYAPDDGDNWKGENWRAATEALMREGGGRVDPKWALPGFTYYGGRKADTGWVLERAEHPEDFARGHRVRAWFGERLRMVRRDD